MGFVWSVSDFFFYSIPSASLNYCLFLVIVFYFLIIFYTPRLGLMLLTHITSTNPHLQAKGIVSGKVSWTIALTAGAKAAANAD